MSTDNSFTSSFLRKSIDKYSRNMYDKQVCRIVRYKYVLSGITEASE